MVVERGTLRVNEMQCVPDGFVPQWRGGQVGGRMLGESEVPIESARFCSDRSVPGNGFEVEETGSHARINWCQRRCFHSKKSLDKSGTVVDLRVE